MELNNSANIVEADIDEAYVAPENDLIWINRGSDFKRLLRSNVRDPLNARRFGAKCNNDDDDTDALIKTVEKAVLDAGGMYPVTIDGCAKLGGPIITSAYGGNPEAQIPIPPAEFGDGTLCHLTIRGSSTPTWITGGALADIGHSMKGPIIRSVRSGVTSGVAPSVIGAVPVAGSFNYNFLTLKDLTILVDAGRVSGTGPCIGGVNGRDLASLIVDGCTISIDGAAYDAPVPRDFTHGIIMTRKNGESMSQVRNTLVNGMYYAFVPGEHANLNNAQAFNSAYAFTILPNYHSIYMEKVLVSWCAYGIAMPNGTFLGESLVPTHLNCKHLQMEIRTGPTWNATIAVISDPGNHLRGQCFYDLVENGSGIDVSTSYGSIKSGGRNLLSGPVTTGQFEWADADARPEDAHSIRGMRGYNVETGQFEEYRLVDVGGGVMELQWV